MKLNKWHWLAILSPIFLIVLSFCAIVSLKITHTVTMPAKIRSFTSDTTRAEIIRTLGHPQSTSTIKAASIPNETLYYREPSGVFCLFLVFPGNNQPPTYCGTLWIDENTKRVSTFHGSTPGAYAVLREFSTP
jgi:hypothetical protein